MLRRWVERRRERIDEAYRECMNAMNEWRGALPKEEAKWATAEEKFHRAFGELSRARFVGPAFLYRPARLAFYAALSPLLLIGLVVILAVETRARVVEARERKVEK